MAVEIQIRPNPLTNPPSYSAQVRPRETVSFEALIELTAQASNTSEAEVERILRQFIDVVGQNLVDGKNVHIAGLGSLGLSVSARIEGPESDVPENSTINVVSRAAPDLVRRIRNEAQLVKVPDRNREPVILEISAVQGDIQALSPGNLLQISGENLNYNPGNQDEGVFLLIGDQEIQAQVYERGRKKLSFFIPPAFTAGEPLSIEVRARTRNTTSKSPLRVGRWQVSES